MIGIGNDFFVDLVNVKRYVYRAIFCLKSKTKVVHSCLSLHTSYIGPQKRISRHLLLLSADYVFVLHTFISAYNLDFPPL